MHVRAFDRNMHLAGVFCVHRRVEGVKVVGFECVLDGMQ